MTADELVVVSHLPLAVPAPGDGDDGREVVHEVEAMADSARRHDV